MLSAFARRSIFLWCTEDQRFPTQAKELWLDLLGSFVRAPPRLSIQSHVIPLESAGEKVQLRWRVDFSSSCCYYWNIATHGEHAGAVFSLWWPRMRACVCVCVCRLGLSPLLRSWPVLFWRMGNSWGSLKSARSRLYGCCSIDVLRRSTAALHPLSLSLSSAILPRSSEAPRLRPCVHKSPSTQFDKLKQTFTGGAFWHWRKKKPS